MQLYPLQFKPIFKYRLWGGDKLRTVLNKTYEGDQMGESWEISDVQESETLVENGLLQGYSLRRLISEFKEDFLGTKIYERFGNEFPLLIKFIDAAKPLSVQVHPNDDLARARYNSFGKNEMWYIMQAEEDAELIVGFNKDIDQNTYEQHLCDGTLHEILNAEKVNSGDVYHIPTGRVHAIGAGVLLAEIQQTSDITYRIYDYDRVDAKTGCKRELHNEQAKAAIDYNAQKRYDTPYSLEKNVSSTVVHTPYFKTNMLHITKEQELDYRTLDSFVIYMCVSGHLKLTYNAQEYHIKKGETLLLPATIQKVMLTATEAKVLEIFL